MRKCTVTFEKENSVSQEILKLSWQFWLQTALLVSLGQLRGNFFLIVRPSGEGKWRGGWRPLLQSCLWAEAACTSGSDSCVAGFSRRRSFLSVLLLRLKCQPLEIAKCFHKNYISLQKKFVRNRFTLILNFCCFTT